MGSRRLSQAPGAAGDVGTQAAGGSAELPMQLQCGAERAALRGGDGAAHPRLLLCWVQMEGNGTAGLVMGYKNSVSSQKGFGLVFGLSQGLGVYKQMCCFLPQCHY